MLSRALKGDAPETVCAVKCTRSRSRDSWLLKIQKLNNKQGNNKFHVKTDGFSTNRINTNHHVSVYPESKFCWNNYRNRRGFYLSATVSSSRVENKNADQGSYPHLRAEVRVLGVSV